MRIRENLLRRVAAKSDHKSYKHSAIILDGSRIVSQGFNLLHTHAEASAINKVKHLRSLNGCLLISFRIGRLGRIGISKPCKSCSFLIKSYGINKVIYFDGIGWTQ